MKTHSFLDLPLGHVAARAVQLGRELARLSQDIGIDIDASDAPCLALPGSGFGNPFDDRHEQFLRELRRVVEDHLSSEPASTEIRYVEAGWDEFGPVFEARERPVYNERGERLLGMLGVLDEFVAARSATLDRIAAERAIERLKTG
jgi:hypothetical protein